jgi:hypothetical protein
MKLNEKAWEINNPAEHGSFKQLAKPKGKVARTKTANQRYWPLILNFLQNISVD